VVSRLRDTTQGYIYSGSFKIWWSKWFSSVSKHFGGNEMKMKLHRDEQVICLLAAIKYQQNGGSTMPNMYDKTKSFAEYIIEISETIGSDCIVCQSIADWIQITCDDVPSTQTHCHKVKQGQAMAHLSRFL